MKKSYWFPRLRPFTKKEVDAIGIFSFVILMGELGFAMIGDRLGWF